MKNRQGNEQRRIVVAVDGFESSKAALGQARAGALDKLLASGALPDATVPGGRDDVQSQLDALTASHDVDDELARMTAQLPASAAPPAVEDPSPAGLPGRIPVTRGQRQ